jgi:Tetratricopeptide repeat
MGQKNALGVMAECACFQMISPVQGELAERVLGRGLADFRSTARKKNYATFAKRDYHRRIVAFAGTHSGVAGSAGLGARAIWQSKYSQSIPAIALRCALLCGLAISFSASPSGAQQHSSNQANQKPIPSGSDSAPISLMPDIDNVEPIEGVFNASNLIPAGADSAQLVNAEACNSWTQSGVRSPTVSMTRLEVPGKAAGEYQKACGAYKDKKFNAAEDHARKAIDLYPSYAAAWVVLGQVLDAEQKRDEAHKACSQAVNIDPKYVAPYLCLAEFAATEEDWQQVSKMSISALALDPVSNPYSLYYSADSGLHLQKMVDAERDALAAVKLDTWNHIPQLHLLLSRIYAAEGDTSSEIAQLKSYLKIAPNTADSPGAKSTLAILQAHPQATPGAK